MRSGWNAKLRNLLHRADPALHLVAEVVKVIAADIRVTKDDWSGADSFTGFDVLNSGGARLQLASTSAISQPSDDGALTTQLTSVPPLSALLIEWDQANAEEIEIGNLVARLNPRVDGGQPNEVYEWRAQLFRVIERGPEIGRIVVIAISRIATVSAAGDLVSDITFDFVREDRAPVVGAPPAYTFEDDPQKNAHPQTLVRIWAVKTDGNPASNVAWMSSSAIGATLQASSYTVRHFTLLEGDSTFGREVGGRTVYSLSDTVAQMPRFTLNRATYTAATITFSQTGKLIDLGAVPTQDPEIVASGQTPGDSTITYEIHDGTAWVECFDGDIIGQDNRNDDGVGSDLSGVALQQTYQMRATLTPTSSGFGTPIVRRLGVREVETTDLSGIATVQGAGWQVDPRTLKGNVPKAEIHILKTGERDYRYYGSELLSQHHIGEIELRVWVGDVTGVYLRRSEWLHVDSFEVEDYRNTDTAHVVVGVSPIRRLRKQVPPFVATGPFDGKREPVEYANQTIKAAATDIITNLVGLPTRLVGPEIEDTSLVGKTIKKADAKDELDRLAYLAGYGVISSQGQVKAVRMVRDGLGAETPAAVFLPGDYTPIEIGPGYATRVDEFFVPYGWDDDSESFAAEARRVNGTAVVKLAGQGLQSTDRLDEETAKWIPNLQLADAVALRVTNHFGNGLIPWRIRSTFPQPHLEPGDPVVVVTDQFVGRSPNTDQEIRGTFSALGVISRVGDFWGRDLTVWIPSFDDVVALAGDVTRLNYLKPAITESEIVFAPDGSVRYQGQVEQAGSVRAVVDKTAFQGSGTVDVQALQLPDADGWFDFEVAAASSYALGDTAYLTAHAYEKADGTGARSTPITKRQRTRSSTSVSGKIWVEVDTAAKTLGMHASVEGASNLFPATLTLYQDDPTGVAIDLDGAGKTVHTFTASGQSIGPTGSGATTEYSGLTAIALPKKAALKFFGRLASASGAVGWLFSMGDLDRLPGGSATADDYRANPKLVLRYDDDVAEILVTTPSGPKTFSGLSGGGQATYEVGVTQLDDLSTESALTESETRTGYMVTFYGASSASGPSFVAWDGPLHGAIGKPVLTHARLDKGNGDQERHQFVVTDPNATVALYYRRYTKGGAPPAYTRVPTTGFSASPLTQLLEFAKPAEGAQPEVLEAYGENANAVQSDPIYLEIDGDGVPRGAFDTALNQETGVGSVTPNAVDTDANSWRFRVTKTAIGTDTFSDPVFNDSAADEFKGTAFGAPVDLTGYALQRGEQINISGWLFRTATATAAAQSASVKSANIRVQIKLGAETGNWVRLGTMRPVPVQSGGVTKWEMYVPLFVGPTVKSVNVDLSWVRVNTSPPPATTTFQHSYNIDLSADTDHKLQDAAAGTQLFVREDYAIAAIVTPYDAIGGSGGAGTAGDSHLVKLTEQLSGSGAIGIRTDDGGGGIVEADRFVIAPAVGLRQTTDSNGRPNIELAVDALTEDATPDGAADYVPTYDASGAVHKKVKLNNLPGAGGVSDHGLLTGLADDDHTQYYNAARHTKAVHDALGIDHGSLSGLADDDHSQYVHNSVPRTITAQHDFAPSVAQAPFTLGVNAQGQKVTGLNADQLDGNDSTAFATAGHNHDHGTLTGLADDDHTQYMHTSSSRTVSAVHTYNPSVAGAPFSLGANAAGQLVTGLNADQLDGNDGTAFATAGHTHDHGTLTGLGDDDHPQYMQKAGGAFTGAITGTTASFSGDVTSNTSDRRLKAEILPLVDALERVLELQGVTYRWNERAHELCDCAGDERRVGLIAQDVRAVLPEAIRPSPMGEEYLAILPEMVLPLVVEALKELAARVAALEAAP